MADGSYQPIQNLRHDAVVMADDPHDNQPPLPARVRSQIETHNTMLLDISYAGTATLTCTVEHPFYTVNRGWVMATDLRSGDQFIAPDAHTFTVNSVKERSGLFTTYNLDVDGPDTFFVTYDESNPAVLTHNMQGEETMFGYLPASGQTGTSQKVNFFTGQLEFNTDGTPKMRQNPIHHFHFDAAVKAVCSGIDEIPMAWSEEWLKDVGAAPRTAFPAIELTNEQHYAAHQTGEQWLAANGYPRSSSMRRDDWIDLYSKGKMNELAEVMMNGANTRGANITPDKINRLKNATIGRIAQFHRLKNCAGL